jgi:hypothetical protein
MSDESLQAMLERARRQEREACAAEVRRMTIACVRCCSQVMDLHCVADRLLGPKDAVRMVEPDPVKWALQDAAQKLVPVLKFGPKPEGGR